jgi:hypothetical protein
VTAANTVLTTTMDALRLGVCQMRAEAGCIGGDTAPQIRKAVTLVRPPRSRAYCSVRATEAPNVPQAEKARLPYQQSRWTTGPSSSGNSHWPSIGRFRYPCYCSLPGAAAFHEEPTTIAVLVQRETAARPTGIPGLADIFGDSLQVVSSVWTPAGSSIHPALIRPASARVRIHSACQVMVAGCWPPLAANSRAASRA